MTGRARVLLAAAVAAVLVFGAGGASAASPEADAYGRQVFREANAHRHHEDVPEVARNRCLQAAAVRHAIRMGRAGQQSDPDRAAIRRDCGLKTVFAVVAGGFPSGRATVRGWTRDPRARDVLLHDHVALAGAAARRGQNGTWFAVLVLGRAKKTGTRAPAAAPSDTYEQQAFAATNAARARHHRRALRHDRCLQRFAEKNARHIARLGQLVHQDLGRIQRRCGVGYVGENIAVGYASGRDVVRGWMHSEGHRANILSTHYRALGLAAVRARGQWWAVQVFADG